MSARLAGASLDARLRSEFDATTLDPWGTGALPVARPADEAELLELLRFAAAERLRLLPVGHATKIGRRLPPVRVDLLVETSAFSGLIAFEPGDGTLTAGGGASLDELTRLCLAGGRTLVPEVAPGATLGGLVATAETGTDRLLRGPVREHVLGLRVVLASGRSSRSGGRLVKNVAGYDLHRLHTGGWGRLGIIVEATLRLFPAWRVQRCLELSVPDLRVAVDAAGRLRATRLTPKRLFVTTGPGAASHLRFDLAGRADVVVDELAALQQLFPGAYEVDVSTPEPRPALVLHALPSAAADLADVAGRWLGELPAAWNAVLHFDPALARAAFALDGPSSPEVTAFAETRDVPPSIQRALPPLPTPVLPVGALGLIERLETAFDPDMRFAR